MSVIAEVKRASPSKGPLAPDLDPAELAERARSGRLTLPELALIRRPTGSVWMAAASVDVDTRPDALAASDGCQPGGIAAVAIQVESHAERRVGIESVVGLSGNRQAKISCNRTGDALLCRRIKV